MTKKLMMFAVAGALVPAANASAEVRAPKVSVIIPSPTTDVAPVSGTPARLRRTDSEQAGNEMNTFALFADGKTGIHFAMTTELNGVAATRRVQLSAVPFALTQEADGSVVAKADLTKGKFVTNNNGNEYRQAHVPVAFAIDGGNAVCAQYNWQPQGTNDTKLYIQCFDSTLKVVMPQTEAFAKNNDDVCGSIENNVPAFIDKNGGTERYIRWCLANGNGSDNAWAFVSSITKKADGTYTYARNYDLTILQQEERSRGMCQVGPDKTFAVCAGTEGNNQPQRNGTWLAAVDLTPGKYNGSNQQAALLWKQQIGGRADIGGRRTYSMRAMIQPVLSLQGDKVVPTDMYFWRSGAVEGNNNTNGKGGSYFGQMAAVMKVTRQGMTYVTPMANLATDQLLGVDGTHNTLTPVLLGAGADLKPGLLVHTGSHTGGNTASTVRALSWDQTAGFKVAGDIAGPPQDRHLYNNYLGNNPGNQGRGHSFSQMVANPFFGQAGNNDKFLVLFATAGKGDVMAPEKKLQAYLSVMPVASGAPPAQAGTGGGTTGGTTGGTGGATDDGSTDGSDTTLGGCSAGGSTGLATFLLIGLAAFIRRRR